MIVDERKPEFRREMIDFLEQKGYRIEKEESRSKEEIIKAVLPIVVNPETKEYRMMGNVTCAAAAVSKGNLFSREEFYGLTGGSNDGRVFKS